MSKKDCAGHGVLGLLVGGVGMYFLKPYIDQWFPGAGAARVSRVAAVRRPITRANTNNPNKNSLANGIYRTAFGTGGAAKQYSNGSLFYID